MSKGAGLTKEHIPVGKYGETLATNYLIENGYTVVGRNYHSRFGEIDIIALYDNFICFVEVKSRTKPMLADGREYVTSSKQHKIIKTAEYFLMSNSNYCEYQPRFDCVEVTYPLGYETVYAGDQSAVIKYFENAF